MYVNWVKKVSTVVQNNHKNSLYIKSRILITVTILCSSLHLMGFRKTFNDIILYEKLSNQPEWYDCSWYPLRIGLPVVERFDRKMKNLWIQSTVNSDEQNKIQTPNAKSDYQKLLYLVKYHIESKYSPVEILLFVSQIRRSLQVLIV